MRNHRYVTPQESDYKALAEGLSMQLHILKLRYHYICTCFRMQSKIGSPTLLLATVFGRLYVIDSFTEHVNSDGRQ